MRHLKRGRKLNRTSAHRRAMVRNLVTSLFVHGRVSTTPAKAKEARPFAEKLITLAKCGTLHARRRAISLLHDERVVASLFAEIGPRYANRPGGYCRILHTAKIRVGDGAPQAIFELVEEGVVAKPPKGKKGRSSAALPAEGAIPAATAGNEAQAGTQAEGDRKAD